MRSIDRVCLAAIALVLFMIPSSAAVAAGWPAGGVRVSLSAQRVAGADRYATAAAIAKDGYPGWSGVQHVIIASGETAALCDVVAAGGLVWAYDAPLLLVRETGVPSAVATALREIRSVNGMLTVTIIGGPSAVSAACADEIEAITGPGSVLRPFAGGDRYSTAAGVATLMQEAAATSSRSLPPVALVANGMNASGFFDALALSAVSAKTGAPVLFVKNTSVPSATASHLASATPTTVIVAGGTAAVSASVFSAVGGTERAAGADRYGTSVAVARLARTNGWLDSAEVGIAGAVIDAVAGAGPSGRAGSPMLLTERGQLGETPSRYLAELGSTVTSVRVYGGPATVSDAAFAQLKGSPAVPTLVAPAGGKSVAKYAYVKVRTGVNTTQVDLYAGTTLVGSSAVSSFGTVDFGKRAMPATGVSFRVVAANPDGGRATRSASYSRLAYPASTSIVVDKSDFRLYWVKDDVLVKSYPVATGRPGMETPVATWKILAKYQTDPAGVYGPRKMRLFKRVASGSGYQYVYTAYGIHGTNEPWVIGTKASHGCIRMYNSDVLELWPQVPLGTLVQTRE